MNLQEAKRIIESRGYRMAKTNSIDDAIKLRAAKRIVENAGYTVVNENDDGLDASETNFDDIDESCRDRKKKGKKKDKKSDFVPFWAKKKKIDERFGYNDGTTFTGICEKYLKDSYIATLVKELGLEGAKEEFLADVREYIGHGISETYYRTFAARIRHQSLIEMIYSISNAMLAGQGNDLNAGTPRSAAARRNRRGPNAARNHQ